MASIAIAGDIGTGKTLLATYFALVDDRDVFANYKIEVPKWAKLTPAAIEKIHQPALLIIDEAYIWLESRASSSLANRFWTYVLFQSRKRATDLVLTCQLFSTIDVRFREMVDRVIVAKRLEAGFGYHIYKPGQDRPVGRFLISNEMAQKIYPYYDTMQLVSPIDSFMIASIEDDPEAINALIDRIVSEIRMNIQGIPIQRYMVEDYVTQAGYPDKLAKKVWNRINSKKETTT